MSNSSYEEQLERYGSFVYTNVGTSMMPLIRQHRDLMVIRKRPEGRLHKYDVVLFRRPNGKYILHRILKVRPNDYILCGDNQWHREKGVKEDWILGVLSAVVRDGKEYPLQGRRYWCYVHLWCDFFWIRAAVIRIRDKLRKRKRKA